MYIIKKIVLFIFKKIYNSNHNNILNKEYEYNEDNDNFEED